MPFDKYGQFNSNVGLISFFRSEIVKATMLGQTNFVMEVLILRPLKPSKVAGGVVQCALKVLRHESGAPRFKVCRNPEMCRTYLKFDLMRDEGRGMPSLRFSEARPAYLGTKSESDA
ncbi:protein of unknown function [Nitrospira japonica]|uniref:Uncharacterized protein n=1 Tax=Nitrospira japonica TaxID=1325564 RepID=A0A1W1I258_9BACT|nr:protein of unknown function [Nitrospira japonica]